MHTNRHPALEGECSVELVLSGHLGSKGLVRASPAAAVLLQPSLPCTPRHYPRSGHSHPLMRSQNTHFAGLPAGRERVPTDGLAGDTYQMASLTRSGLPKQALLCEYGGNDANGVPALALWIIDTHC